MVDSPKSPPFRSHGDGEYSRADFRILGQEVVLEPGILVFHPETISIGAGTYVGHRAILKGYFNSEMHIGQRTWIGQSCFFHSAGGLFIGDDVGIGPNVTIITSQHEIADLNLPILRQPLRFAPVRIENGADIGVASVILPGICIGEGAVVGAGSVVTKDVEPYAVVAGNPARLLRKRS